MKGIFLLSLTTLVIAAGCSQSGGSSETTSSTNRSMTNDGAFGQYMGGLAQAKQTAGKTVDVTSLTRVVQQFQVDKGRYPTDLNELVQEKYISRIPDAPYGMKIDYDPTTGDVKVVNQ
jgi:hypothetical protein